MLVAVAQLEELWNRVAKPINSAAKGGPDAWMPIAWRHRVAGIRRLAGADVRRDIPAETRDTDG